MLKQNFYVTVTVFLLIFLCLSVVQARNVKFRRIDVTYSEDYYKNFTLYAANDSAYMDMDLLKTLSNGFRGYLDFQVRISAKKYQSIFTYHMDVCGLVASLKDVLFKKWFNSLLKYGNFNAKCPVLPGHYYLRGWSIDSSLTPSYFYAGSYRFKAYLYYGKYKTKEEIFVANISCDATVE